MSVFFMHQRYQYDCVFVDQHSDFTYVHILKYQNVYEAVESKEAFWAYVESHGADIKHYHVYNVILLSVRWMIHC